MQSTKAAADFAMIIAVDTTAEPYCICIYERNLNKATTSYLKAAELDDILYKNSSALLLLCSNYASSYLGMMHKENIVNEIRKYSMDEINAFKTGSSREHLAAAILQAGLSPKCSYS